MLLQRRDQVGVQLFYPPCSSRRWMKRGQRSHRKTISFPPRSVYFTFFTTNEDNSWELWQAAKKEGCAFEPVLKWQLKHARVMIWVSWQLVSLCFPFKFKQFWLQWPSTLHLQKNPLVFCSQFLEKQWHKYHSFSFDSIGLNSGWH